MAAARKRSSCIRTYAAILRTFQAFFDRRDVSHGCIASLQPFGGHGANFNPHAYALVSDGVFNRDGEFLPLPAPDPAAVMEVFRPVVFLPSHLSPSFPLPFRIEMLISIAPLTPRLV